MESLAPRAFRSRRSALIRSPWVRPEGRSRARSEVAARGAPLLSPEAAAPRAPEPRWPPPPPSAE